MAEPETAEELGRRMTVTAIDAAFAEQVKIMFGSFMRHMPNVQQARSQFRKDLATAQQARSEMIAISRE